MIKYIVAFLLLIVTTLSADFNFQPYQVTLDKSEKKSAIILAPQAKIGTTGVVIHAFDKTHKTIIALAEVTKKLTDNRVEISFKPYKHLQQKALPSYKITPKKGDIVILNYLYNQVLPIVPTKEAWTKFQKEYQSLLPLHPDLFASYLYFEHTPRPTKEEFRHICHTYDFNLLFFAIEDKGYFVDCNSFKTLKKVNFPTTKAQPMLPFYSRVPQIKNRLGGIMGSESIGNYTRYYQNLLGVKDAR